MDDDKAAKAATRSALIRALVMRQGQLNLELQAIELQLRRMGCGGAEAHNAQMDLTSMADEERADHLERITGLAPGDPGP